MKYPIIATLVNAAVIRGRSTSGRAGRPAFIVGLCLGLAACSTTTADVAVAPEADINDDVKFSVAEYGVAASERVTTSQVVPKGGGRAMVGVPYQIRGKWYTPKEDSDYNKTGLASWYGPNFHGRSTANGEIYDQHHLSAAHPTFPLPSYARVTNGETGHSVVVRVNDRGPFTGGRIIDVSRKTAEMLDFKHRGVAEVNVEYIGPAPLDGQDMPFLMASYRPADDDRPSVDPTVLSDSGTMLAWNDTMSRSAGNGAFGRSHASTVMSEASAVDNAPASLPRIGPVLADRPVLRTSVPSARSPTEPLHPTYAEDRLQMAYAASETPPETASMLSAAAILDAWGRRKGMPE